MFGCQAEALIFQSGLR
ncbi:YfcZ/YiiS family protein [Xenorhabdus koppenhoeferi]